MVTMKSITKFLWLFLLAVHPALPIQLATEGPTAYIPSEARTIGQNLKITSARCGNSFTISGAYLIRLHGENKNMISDGKKNTPQGQFVKNPTYLSAVAFGGVTLTFAARGTFQISDIRDLNTQIRWDSGTLLGVRSILIQSDRSMSMILTGKDMSLISVPYEHSISIQGVFGVGIILPCEVPQYSVVLRSGAGDVAASNTGTTAVLQPLATGLLTYQVTVLKFNVFISGVDGGSFRGPYEDEGIPALPPGKIIKGANSFLFVGESINIQVPACWIATARYETCTGQLIVLSLTEPGSCYLMVILARPKCDPNFRIESTSTTTEIKGAYKVDLLISTSPSCPSVCPELPDVSIAVQPIAV